MSYQVPQTRIFQTFGESVTVNVSSLTPVVVAPLYDVYDNFKVGLYENANVTFPYVGLSGSDMIVDGDIAGGVFKTFIRNAQVKGYAPITWAGDSGQEGDPGFIGADNKSLFTGLVVANGGGFPVPAGFPALSIGDTVVQAASGGTVKKVFKIAAFQQAGVEDPAVSLPTYDTAADHAETDMQIVVGEGFDPDVNQKLVFTITAGGTVGTDSVKASLAVNGVTVQSNIACGTSAVSLTGLAGLSVKFTSATAWTVGDKITVGVAAPAEATAQYNQGYSIVVLDDEVATPATGDTFTLYYGAGDITDPTGAAWNASTGLTLTAPLSKNGMQIFSGDVYVTYRIRKNDLNEKVYFAGTTTELTRLIGEKHPLNPMSIMCDLAMRNADGVGCGFISVPFDNLASYTKALEVIGTDTSCWSIVPYSEDVSIQNMVFDKIREFSSPAVMNWKTGWFGHDVADEEVVLDSFDATIGDGSSGDTSQNIYVDPADADISKVRFGDTVIVDGSEYSVLGVFTAVEDPYIWIDTPLASGVKTGLKVISKIDAGEKAAQVAAYAKSYNHERIRVFYADTPYLVDFPGEACPMCYLAAAWAGKRAGAAPHQPLTRSDISGIACKGTGGFSVDDLNTMADDGVWLTVTDADGSTYCRHQLTTKESDDNYNFKEDSKVANADEITMTIRSGLDKYYGRTNVTDAALEVIRLKAEQVILTIQSRVWPDLLGPQVTDVESITIEPDANFSDRVNLHITLDTPNPLNNLDIYLTIR